MGILSGDFFDGIGKAGCISGKPQQIRVLILDGPARLLPQLFDAGCSFHTMPE